MKRIKEIKILKRIWAALTAIILLFAMGAAALNASGQSQGHTLSIGYSEIGALMELGPEDFVFTTYEYRELSPTTVIMDGNVMLFQESEPDTIHIYRLHQAVADLVDQLYFPLDSSTMRMQVLQALEDMVLVHFFDALPDGTNCDGCQALMVMNPESKDLSLIAINHEDTGHHLAVEIEGVSLEAQDMLLLLQEGHMEESLTDKELENLLRQSGTDVELLETREQFLETKDRPVAQTNDRNPGIKQQEEPVEEKPGPDKHIRSGNIDGTNNEPDGLSGSNDETLSKPRNSTGDELTDTGSGNESPITSGGSSGDESVIDPGSEESANPNASEPGEQSGGKEDDSLREEGQSSNSDPGTRDNGNDASGNQDGGSGQDSPATGAEPVAHRFVAETQPAGQLHLYTANFSPTDSVGSLSLSVGGFNNRSPSADTAPEGEGVANIPGLFDYREESNEQPDEASILDFLRRGAPLADTENQSSILDSVEATDRGTIRNSARNSFSRGISLGYSGRGISLGHSGGLDAPEVTHKAIVVLSDEQLLAESTEIALDAPGNGVAILSGVMAPAAVVGSHGNPHVVTNLRELRSAIENDNINPIVHVNIANDFSMAGNPISVVGKGLVLSSNDENSKTLTSTGTSRHFAINPGRADRQIIFQNVYLSGNNTPGGGIDVDYKLGNTGGVAIIGAQIFDCINITGNDGVGGAIHFANETTGENLLKDCIIWNCHAEHGGAVYLKRSQLTIQDCKIGLPPGENNENRGNSAETSGGGIYCSGNCTVNIVGTNPDDPTYIQYNKAGNATITENLQRSQGGGGICVATTGSVNFSGDVVVQHNLADNSHAGGMYCAGNMSVSGSARFLNNEATYGLAKSYSGAGGGIMLDDKNAMDLRMDIASGGNLLIQGNKAGSYGGGLNILRGHLNLAIASEAKVEIIENHAGMDAGGIQINEWTGEAMPVSLTVDNSNTTGTGLLLRNNTAEENGGGIRVPGIGWLTFTGKAGSRNEIIGNEANMNGGGIYATISQKSVAATISVSGDTLLLIGSADNAALANKAGEKGGGIFLGNKEMLNVSSKLSVSGNRAVTGAGIFSGGAVITVKPENGQSEPHLSVTGNTASGQGGGIAFDGTSTVTVSPDGRLEVISNEAFSGGGLCVLNGTLRLNDAGSTAGRGGAVSVEIHAAKEDSNFSKTTSPLRSPGLVENQINSSGDNLYPGPDIKRKSVTRSGDSFVVEGNASTGNGGGIFLDTNTLLDIASKLTVVDNQASRGGGVYADNAGISVAAQDFSIDHNTATWEGGGMSFEGTNTVTVLPGGALQIINNEAHSGGGVFLLQNGTLTLDNEENTAGRRGAITIEENTAKQDGSGIRVHNNATLLLPGPGETRVYNNETTNGNGGGIYLDTGAKLDVNTSSGTRNGKSLVVEENTCTGNGGGLYVSDKAAATLTASLVSKNKASFGGGAFIAWQAASPRGGIQLYGAEVSGNAAQEDGGGVYIRVHQTMELGSKDNYSDSNQSGAAWYSTLYADSDSSFSGNTAGKGYSLWELTAPPSLFNRAAADIHAGNIFSSIFSEYDDGTGIQRRLPHAYNNYDVNNYSPEMDRELIVTKTVRDRYTGDPVPLPDTTFTVELTGPIDNPGHTQKTYVGQMDGSAGGNGRFVFADALPRTLPPGTYTISERNHEEYQLVAMAISVDGGSSQPISDGRFTVPDSYQTLEIVIANQQKFPLEDLTMEKVIQHYDKETGAKIIGWQPGMVPDGTSFTVKVENAAADISFTATVTVGTQGNAFRPGPGAPRFLPSGTYTVTEDPLTSGYNWVGGFVRYGGTGSTEEWFSAADKITFTIADNTGKINISVVNEKPLLELKWRKVDAWNYTPLEGAEFTLYGCVSEEANHVHSDYAAGGSCWTKVITTAISDNEGLLVFRDVPEGVYQLVETKAPGEYALPAGQWRITVTSRPGTDGLPVPVIEVECKGEYGWQTFAFIDPHSPNFSGTESDAAVTHWIPNRVEWVLPATGGGYILFAISAMSILLGILLAARARRAER